jgi:atypical dual specificity phosphatase
MYNPLNFSWVMDGKLAGHGAITTTDDIDFIRNQGIKALVRMAGGEPATSMHQKLLLSGLDDLHLSVTNFSAPTQKQIAAMIDFINSSVAKGWPVSVSCGAGYGRAGTVLACYLITQGFSAHEAIEAIRDKRPGSIETPEQEQAVWEYFKNLKNN